MTIRLSLIAALVATASLASFSSAAAQPGPKFNGFPAPQCSRPMDQEAMRVNQLADLLAETRAQVDKNPLLWATVGYYEAELAATKRCLQSASAGQAIVR
jgi:hypothetical protein